MPVLEKLLSFGRKSSGQHRDWDAPRTPTRKCSEYEHLELDKLNDRQVYAHVPPWSGKAENRWQGVDFSTNSYCQDRHPLTKEWSRTLTDVDFVPLRPPVRVVPEEPVEVEVSDNKKFVEDQDAAGTGSATGTGAANTKPQDGVAPPQQASSSSSAGASSSNNGASSSSSSGVQQSRTSKA